MRLIKYSLRVPVIEGECILIHTLTSRMFVLGAKEHQMFCQWENSENIQPKDQLERELLSTLQDNKFLVESEEEEAQMKNDTLKMSKEIYKKSQDIESSATFVLTYACNYECPYCYEKGADDHTSARMTREMVDSIFRLHNDSIKHISLFGGEPLLLGNKEVIEYIISKAPNANFSVTTNGYYLEEYYPLFSNLEMNRIMITFDGEEAVHNKTRVLRNGEGTYHKTVKGLEKFLTNGTPITIRMNVSNDNYKSCLALKEKFIETYKEAHDNGKLSFEMQPLFGYSVDSRGELEEQLYFPTSSADEMKPMRDRDNSISKSLSPILSVFSRPRKFYPSYSHCGAESSYRFYDADGYIYSCILSLGKTRASVGKYFPKVEMKESSLLTRNIETIPQCKVCKLSFLCGGGCANAIIDDSGDVMKPFCGRIKYEIEHMLPSLYAKYKKEGKI